MTSSKDEALSNFVLCLHPEQSSLVDAAPTRREDCHASVTTGLYYVYNVHN